MFKAIKESRAICAEYAFVVATAISSPEFVYNKKSTFLAIVLPSLLIIPRVSAPSFFALSIAFKVSPTDGTRHLIVIHQ